MPGTADTLGKDQLSKKPSNISTLPRTNLCKLSNITIRAYSHLSIFWQQNVCICCINMHLSKKSFPMWLVHIFTVQFSVKRKLYELFQHMHVNYHAQCNKEQCDSSLNQLFYFSDLKNKMQFLIAVWPSCIYCAFKYKCLWLYCTDWANFPLLPSHNIIHFYTLL